MRRLFLLVLALLVLTCTGAYLTLLSWAIRYADVQALQHIVYHNYGYYTQPLAATAAHFHEFRFLLTCFTLLISTVTGWQLAYAPAWRAELRQLGAELRAAGGSLRRAVGALPAGARWVAIGTLLALTVLRLALAWAYPLHTDEVATYDYFVRRGLAAVTSFYPIPNNHVLHSLLSWVAYQISPAVRWTLRGPTLLVGLGGSALLFAGVLRRSHFTVALLSVGLFSLSPLGLYYAVLGRGYLLLTVLAGILFLVVVELADAPARRRALWSVFALTTTLGFYTIPVFFYAVASAVAYLALRWLLAGQKALLPELGGVLAVSGLATLLLYSPLLLVSGPAALTHNAYVAPLSGLRFWPAAGQHLLVLGNTLLGQERLGAVLAAAALLAGTLAVHRRVGPPGLRALCMAAYWFVLFPYLCVLLQRVLPPPRVLLYTLVFFFVLVGVLVYVAEQRFMRRYWQRLFLAATLLLGYGSYQVYHAHQSMQQARQRDQLIRQAYAWLAMHPTGPVLLHSPLHELFFLHYSLETHRAWPLYTHPKAGIQYAYVLVPAGAMLTDVLPGATGTYAVAYQDALLTAYVRKAP